MGADPRGIKCFLLWVSILYQASFCGVRSVREVTVLSPGAAAVGDTVTLECLYDLEGEHLYAVKWYKGKKEFYRYVPKENPPFKIFPLPGVNVDLSASDKNKLVMRDANIDMTGFYRCEVSADAPSFETALIKTFLNVVDLPDRGPIIHTERMSYAVGETVRANCTALNTYPPANISWTVNGREARPRHIRHYPPKQEDNNITTSVLGIQMETHSGTFRRGKLTLKCQARMFSIYNKSTEVALEEERPRLASVLGTRESSSDKGSCRVYSVSYLTFEISLLVALLLR